VALDTLAYAKHLEQAGSDRQHAEAIGRFLVPDLATKADLTAGLNSLEQRLEARIHQAEFRILGIVAAMLGLLFALLKFTPG
jgi:hypothetical protein